MQYYINEVRKFNQKYGYPAPGTITSVTPEQSELRIRLIKEELKELREAIDMGFKRSEIIKELCDVIYVYAGAFVERGENTGDFLFVRPMLDGFYKIVHSRFYRTGDFLFVRPMLDVPGTYNALSEAISNIALYGMDYLESDALSKDVRDIVRSVCLRYNIDFDADGLKKAFDIVHASNMSKGTNGEPVYVDGKLQKGEDYVKADLSYLDKPDEAGHKV